MKAGLQIGLKPREVYQCTLYELDQMIYVFRDRRDDAISNLHLMGVLNSFAVNEPKKYPRLSEILPKRKVKLDPSKIKKEAAAKGLRIPGDQINAR